MIEQLRRGILEAAPFAPKGAALIAYVHPDTAPELRTPKAVALLSKWNTTLVVTPDDVEPGYVEVARA